MNITAADWIVLDQQSDGFEPCNQDVHYEVNVASKALTGSWLYSCPDDAGAEIPGKVDLVLSDADSADLLALAQALRLVAPICEPDEGYIETLTVRAPGSADESYFVNVLDNDLCGTATAIVEGASAARFEAKLQQLTGFQPLPWTP